MTFPESPSSDREVDTVSFTWELFVECSVSPRTYRKAQVNRSSGPRNLYRRVPEDGDNQCVGDLSMVGGLAQF